MSDPQGTVNTQGAAKLTERSVRALVQDWYDGLDRHDPVEDVQPFLVSQGLVMRFPEGELRGLEDFRGWYHTVTNKFFDEVHVLSRVDVRPVDGGAAQVSVVVNWQARVWNPPARNSIWLGFDAYQTWTVVQEAGRAKIRTYTVDELVPMPGSASLDEA